MNLLRMYVQYNTSSPLITCLGKWGRKWEMARACTSLWAPWREFHLLRAKVILGPEKTHPTRKCSWYRSVIQIATGFRKNTFFAREQKKTTSAMREKKSSENSLLVTEFKEGQKRENQSPNGSSGQRWRGGDGGREGGRENVGICSA